MKRLFIILSVLILTACNFQGIYKQESRYINLQPSINNTLKAKTTPHLYKGSFLQDITIEAKAAILLNATTKDILFEKETNQKLPVASMSKIMTELLVLEAIDEGKIAWDDHVQISDYAYLISHQPGFASVKLKQDTSYTVKELFYAMAIHSANGATIALAEAVAGSEEQFVMQMNEKAEALNLQNTSFVNSTGLTNKDLQNYHFVGALEDSNKMSARDLAVLSDYLITHFPEILKVTKRLEFEFDDKMHPNSNWMLPDTKLDFLDIDLTFPGVDGLKTGFTKNAGYGFTGTVTIEGIRFISVVIGTEDLEKRFMETKRLYEAVLDQFKTKDD